MDSSSTSSSVSNFGVENGIFLRIINREYRLILGEKDIKEKDDVESFHDAIKVSYYYDNKNYEINYRHANMRKNDKNSSDDFKSKKPEINTIKNMEKNAKNFPVGKKVKSKTYAKIPLQFHEFQNVRLYIFRRFQLFVLLAPACVLTSAFPMFDNHYKSSMSSYYFYSYFDFCDH